MALSFKQIPGIKQLASKLEAIKQLEVENQLRLDELNWANVFNSAIANSKWLHTQSFNPGRWAAGYPMLYILYRIYNDIKPKSILEFGLGESSKLAYQYLQSQPGVRLTIVEQDQNWLNFFSREVHDISANTIVLPVEKQDRFGFSVNQYKNLPEALSRQTYDCIIVDGPFGSEHYSRFQVVDLVTSKQLSDSFVIILDDYERVGEQETASKLREALIAQKIDYAEGVYAGAKQTLLICSANLKFLTSL